MACKRFVGSIPIASTQESWSEIISGQDFFMGRPDVATFSLAFKVIGYVRSQHEDVCGVAPRLTVRWNEAKQRWMAWVRFPDGSRRKVERVEKAHAEADLNELLDLRASG
jgi:hypothetical protein